ncbi:hypothetical protein CEK25_012011 [Fusarium fujikuroi]|nr:hypothetical protein CEK25_012011 [Fusarium fujikuroi]
MAMEHFLLVAEYCTLLAPSTYHQSFLLLHVVHILNPVSLAEPAAPQNHPQSQLRNCHLWNASFQVQELVALHTKGKGHSLHPHRRVSGSYPSRNPVCSIDA